MKSNESIKKYIAEKINLNTNKIDISHETEQRIKTLIKNGEQEFLLQLVITKNSQENNTLNELDGFIFTELMKTEISNIKKKLYHFFPEGLIKFKRSLKINYQPLQELLIKKEFLEADKMTQQYLCNLVEITLNNKKSWLYFTDIQFLPIDDLFTIDLLWRVYSKGKFGFSIQKEVWIKNNYEWNKLWEKIGWTNKGIMKRYPQEFTWKIEAPEGHLPLFNQLRGTQALYSLFKRITW
uniref:GUN4-like domain-containing protein n=1 Tax=Cliftonaea pectinata TaxID=2007206 RepID=A0A1Z1MQA6_9FLOR|nr:hypothetical protein [Cliftonaea pectinata]ARW68049.1 hypothetical protein [Cliftonaea pectinata]